MNTLKPHAFSLAAALSAFALIGVQNAIAQTSVTLYSDNSTFANGNFDYVNTSGGGVGSGEAGNQVVLGDASSPYYQITDFQFYLDIEPQNGNAATAPASTDQMEITMYYNDGPPVQPSGSASPGNVMYQSGWFYLNNSSEANNLGMNQYTTGTSGQLIDDSGLNFVVPGGVYGITWTVSFQGIANNEIAGLSEYNPATVGKNFQDAWVNTGSGWSLVQAQNGNPPLEFGAVISGYANAVPEPKIWVLLLAALPLGLVLKYKLSGRQA